MDPVRWLALLGAISAATSVAAGAFGAHALRGRLSVELLGVFETAVRYQMYHALGLFAAAWTSSRFGVSAAVWAGWAFAVGTVLFSGSLYLLALTGARWWGAVTPLGGVCFIAGWIALAWGIWTAR
ncbi:MAG: membrane protein [Gemmatimonadales bacterium]|nr:hypothetical protein HRbin33_02157 [bacterium HR33]GIW50898.1 MAG: membrane protein [Gemmatimonadales bacterium]